MQSRFLLNVVVGESSAVLKLLSSENESLLVGRDALLVLDLSLDVVDGVGGLDLESDGLAGQAERRAMNGQHRRKTAKKTTKTTVTLTS